MNGHLSSPVLGLSFSSVGKKSQPCLRNIMRNRLHYLGSVFLLFLATWCFWPGFQEIWKTYTSFWLLDNAIAAIVLTMCFAFLTWKYGLPQKDQQTELPGFLLCCGFTVACIALLINNFFGGFQIVAPILAYFVMYL